jgi:electron transport complex protein RnfB
MLHSNLQALSHHYGGLRAHRLWCYYYNATGAILLITLLFIYPIQSTCYNSAMKTDLIQKIDAILPQTQCRQCGFNGCKPYAEEIADGEADINQCPPGGEKNIHQLAQLLDKPFKPLNPENGVEKPFSYAFIDEQSCIGCTLCIQACPVDAIVGANKQMHTVLQNECTGCELCIAPCPVDCITMIPREDNFTITKEIADHARARFEFHNFRLTREQMENERRLAQKAKPKLL